MKQTSKAKRKSLDLRRIALVSSFNLLNNTLTRIEPLDLQHQFQIDSNTAKRVIQIILNTTTRDNASYLPVTEIEWILGKTQPTPEDWETLNNKAFTLSFSESQALYTALVHRGFESNSDIVKQASALFSPEFKNTISSSNTAQHQDARYLLQIAGVCLAQKRISITYINRNKEIKNYLLDPHTIVYVQDIQYLVAWDIKQDKQKSFRLDRILNLQAHAEKTSEHAFNLEEYFTFNPTQFIEFTIHNNEVVEELRSLFGFKMKTETLMTLPYANTLWLVWQIAGCMGGVTTNDQDFNFRLNQYAKEQLDLLQELEEVN